MQSKRDKVPRQTQDRLPTIVPRHDQPSKCPLSPHLKGDAISRSSTARLPPRSRFGCWTCRTRKVKCDEDRPKCTPCARLGHPCDYSPRLSFKDDTPRVLEKMRPYTGSGNSIWNCSSSWPYLKSSFDDFDQEEDLLPPFSMLTNDEDRERKAVHKLPGTYHIVVNPNSFSSLEEYADSQDDESAVGTRPHNLSRRRRSSVYKSNSVIRQDVFEDPDTLIIGKFEENVRKLPTLSLLTTHFDNSRSSSLTSHSSATTYIQSHEVSPLYETVWEIEEDQHITSFYRTFVRSQLNQVHRDSLGTSSDLGIQTIPDILDRQAPHFTPLYHALKAFSALSMAHSQGVQGLNALQHYSKALPLLQNSLHTDGDLSSDGALLTHFVLLLYEIAAAEPRGSNLWMQHLDQLLRIIRLRRFLYGSERHQHILWWIFQISTYSVLSGSGKGEFIEWMLSDGGSSPSILCSQKTDPRVSLVRMPELLQNDSGPSIVEAHRTILTIAARLGLLARELRTNYAHQQTRNLKILHQQQRVMQLRGTLRQYWHGELPALIAMGHGRKPVAARGILEHTQALYHACLIYSYTSMWPHQRLEMSHDNNPEVSHSVSEIFQTAREITANGCSVRKFMVFPLFMAGVASRIPSDQQLAVELLQFFERNSIGKAMVATRHILEIIYQKQREATMHGAHPMMVDWVNTVAERGLQMIDARL